MQRGQPFNKTSLASADTLNYTDLMATCKAANDAAVSYRPHLPDIRLDHLIAAGHLTICHDNNLHLRGVTRSCSASILAVRSREEPVKQQICEWAFLPGHLFVR